MIFDCHEPLAQLVEQLTLNQ